MVTHKLSANIVDGKVVDMTPVTAEIMNADPIVALKFINDIRSKMREQILELDGSDQKETVEKQG